MSTKIRTDEISTILLQELESSLKSVETYEFGTVLQVGDGICRVHGLSQVMSGELVRFKEHQGLQGLVLNLESDNVGIVILGDGNMVREGDIVVRTGKIASVNVGKGTLGRVLNALGEPIDGGPALVAEAQAPIEIKAPGIIDRQNVCEPLYTGIKSIDAMFPIGKGQRELIIGDRKTGKTAITLDAIINQKGKDVHCIYVAVGQKASTIVALVEKLRDHGALEYTTVIAANASDPAPMQYLAPYTGVTLGEYYRDHGMHSLLVYDDLTKHAQAYRQISLLLRRPPGREAFPGDVFYLHSRLLERAAKMSKERGGGSLTALPIIETQAGDISAYIPTNVISITDGQIFLETNLFNAGVRPAVNVGLSVSRVGGDAQIKATKQVAGRLKLTLAQYREMAAFSQFASELDEATRKQLALGERLTELLKQKQFAPYPIERTIIVLFAGVNGYLDSVPLKSVLRYETEMVRWFEDSHGDILKTITADQKITPETDKAIRAALDAYKDVFKA
ncbi:MAG TPA: F0F1 ATP synthase subunit alpha [Fibrobacteraceae bacterium]|nr:F0F1 ATP synthase subunit alpha [Fibrobacteraceae bacterium]